MYYYFINPIYTLRFTFLGLVLTLLLRKLFKGVIDLNFSPLNERDGSALCIDLNV